MRRHDLANALQCKDKDNQNLSLEELSKRPLTFVNWLTFLTIGALNIGNSPAFANFVTFKRRTGCQLSVPVKMYFSRQKLGGIPRIELGIKRGRLESASRSNSWVAYKGEISPKLSFQESPEHLNSPSSSDESSSSFDVLKEGLCHHQGKFTFMKTSLQVKKLRVERHQEFWCCR